MTPTLETDRLRLEKLTSSHFSKDYLNWLNDKEVFEYMVSQGGYTEENLKEYLKSVEGQEDLMFWAIIVKETNKHIGNVKIDQVYWDHGFAEYGIMIGDKTSWGKGYAREASQCAIDYSFREKKLRKINLGVVMNNVAAFKLYEKMGFSIEGRLKYHVCYGGKYLDTCRMAIFNPDFLASISEENK